MYRYPTASIYFIAYLSIYYPFHSEDRVTAEINCGLDNLSVGTGSVDVLATANIQPHMVTNSLR